VLNGEKIKEKRNIFFISFFIEILNLNIEYIKIKNKKIKKNKLCNLTKKLKNKVIKESKKIPKNIFSKKLKSFEIL
jgi:hypothetical protein